MKKVGEEKCVNLISPETLNLIKRTSFSFSYSVVPKINKVLFSCTELHSILFENSTYNPRVIPNMWRKLSALDFADLGTFATDRCKVYNKTVLKYR